MNARVMNGPRNAVLLLATARTSAEIPVAAVPVESFSEAAGDESYDPVYVVARQPGWHAVVRSCGRDALIALAFELPQRGVLSLHGDLLAVGHVPFPIVYFASFVK